MQFLFRFEAPDDYGLKDTPVTRRVLSQPFTAALKAGFAAARKSDEPLLDANWITTGQDLEVASVRFDTPQPDTVVARIKGVAGETPIVTFKFVNEAGLWKLDDVVYGEVKDQASYRKICETAVKQAGTSSPAAPSKRIVRGPGKGYYEPSAINGPAAAAVRSYLENTYADCEIREGVGRCNLGASTQWLEMRYLKAEGVADAYALVQMNVSFDTGNMGTSSLYIWRRETDKSYAFQGSAEMQTVFDAKAKWIGGTAFSISGLVVGKDDAQCCAKTKATLIVRVKDGMLSVADVAERRQVASAQSFASATQAPLPISTSSAVTSDGRTPLAPITNLNLAKGTLNGEQGTSFEHNGSTVLVFEKAGVVLYETPKPQIADTIKPGDLLFSGHISAKGITRGTAYTFKKGCNPAPYAVTGRYNFEGFGGRNELVLSGAAPVPDKASCAIKGYSTASPNAHLKIEFQSDT
ncbi:hypothetical protein [Beijerinckia sp. L45]|uniref:hypothetical protein n=1 Tax=Beijerinckia sp. L45 TaxID=1641855 RepID=UPI00131BF18D|nr:hypothetical protein [Beijerinckia sp. L45]